MKAGGGLQGVLVELEYQNKAKKDYVAPAQGMKPERGNRALLMRTQTPFAAIPLFYRRLASALSIPMKYYGLMQKEKPKLLAKNVSAQLGTRQNNCMVHSMDCSTGPVARALSSEQYRRINNMEIASAVLPLFVGNDGYSVESYEVVKYKLYPKILNRRLEMEIRKGDAVQAGVVISNSEVGLGAVSVQPLVYRLACLNGLIVSGCSERRNHIDRQAETTEDFTLYSDEMLQVEDRAFLLKLRNTTTATIGENRFAQIVDKLRGATGIPIKGNVQEAMELIGREFGITQEERDGIFRYLMEDSDLSLYGLTNATTRMSQDVDSCDRTTTLRWIGWQVMQRRELYV